ncbi:glutathione S-transferase N-terminal domain-containing protein [Pantoea sp. JZ29]|uniref:glutathione S-transferase N-terminal domain-containing protein n=1 Tax=Pantoea sp. JZ29 TaxID=2654192 RepID=UPI002B499F36|nr:glutathione S-transferase N-terminal domain-containing protein [Pantoea sp. JZ29]
MYTLYGSARSGAAAIEMALSLAGAEYTTVEASSWHKDSGFETLKRLNPLVQIPTLILPDGAVLTESAAIMIYLVWPVLMPASFQLTLTFVLSNYEG